jgi:hypothetical protein
MKEGGRGGGMKEGGREGAREGMKEEGTGWEGRGVAASPSKAGKKQQEEGGRGGEGIRKG